MSGARGSEFAVHGELDDVVRAVVDADGFVGVDGSAHGGQNLSVAGQQVEHRADLGHRAALVGAVAELRGADRAPRLVPADAFDHQLRDRVVGKLARLRDQHVRAAHEEVRDIHGREDVRVIERVDARDGAVERGLGEALRALVVVKVRLCHGGELRHLFADDVVHGAVVAEVHQQRGPAGFDVGQELFDHADEQILLRAGAADGHQVAPRRAGVQAVDAVRGVGLDVRHELVVDVVASVVEAALRHRPERLLRHAAQALVAEEARRRLDRVLRALGEVQAHRPVVGDRVDDVRQPRVHGGLRGPHVRRDVGDVLRQRARHGRHELGLLLVGGVVK